MKGIPLDKIRRILVMKPYGGLGDLLLSTPVMHSLKVQFPASVMTAMVKEPFVRAVEGNPMVDEVVGIPDRFTKGFDHFFEQLKTIRQGSYDLAVVLWTSAREAYLLSMAGIPLRVGQGDRLMYSFLFTHQVRRKSDYGDESTHQVENLLDYVRVLGIEPKDRSPYIHTTAEDEESVDALLKGFGIGRDEFIIGFNSTKGLPVTVEQWPTEKFASFAKSLYEHFRAPVVFTGVSREIPIVNAIASHLEGPFYSIAGKTDLGRAAAFIKRCGLFVSPDSGPMHMAAALKTPVVGIYGLKGDYPRRWAPFGGPHRIVRLSKIPCEEKCIKETCRRFACYEAIPDEMVVNAAKELLGK